MSELLRGPHCAVDSGPRPRFTQAITTRIDEPGSYDESLWVELIRRAASVPFERLLLADLVTVTLDAVMPGLARVPADTVALLVPDDQNDHAFVVLFVPTKGGEEPEAAASDHVDD